MNSGEQSYASDNIDHKCKSSVGKVKKNTVFKTMTHHYRQRFDADAVLTVYIFFFYAAIL